VANQSPSVFTASDLLVDTKGKDCESNGAKHAWYNQDDENSACYHCEVIRESQLWRNELGQSSESRQ
jgi:hypothetical protein